MAKTTIQQVQDGLYYLNKPGQDPADEKKAIDILSSIAGWPLKGKEIVVRHELDKLPLDSAGVPWKSVYGLHFVVAVGHQPGGGAEGERVYNKIVAAHMKRILESHGAKVWIYEHKLKSYNPRQYALKAWMKKNVPKCFICWELHYDGYKPRPGANGHHYKFRGARDLAVFTQAEHVKRFPQSLPRSWNDKPGLHHAKNGNGSGFLRICPAWAMLTEPFFITNPAEREFYKDRHEEIALVNCIGGARFAELKNG